MFFIFGNFHVFVVFTISILDGHEMKKFIRSFFYRGKDPQPPYVWISIFCILAIVMLIMKLCGVGYISDTLVISTLGMIVSWAGVYNWYQVRGSRTVRQEIEETLEVGKGDGK